MMILLIIIVIIVGLLIMKYFKPNKTGGLTTISEDCETVKGFSKDRQFHRYHNPKKKTFCGKAEVTYFRDTIFERDSYLDNCILVNCKGVGMFAPYSIKSLTNCVLIDTKINGIESDLGNIRF